MGSLFEANIAMRIGSSLYMNVLLCFAGLIRSVCQKVQGCIPKMEFSTPCQKRVCSGFHQPGKIWRISETVKHDIPRTLKHKWQTLRLPPKHPKTTADWLPKKTLKPAIPSLGIRSEGQSSARLRIITCSSLAQTTTSMGRLSNSAS